MNAPNALSQDKSSAERAAYEPSMEEILASIRRIIADDQVPSPSRAAREFALDSAPAASPNPAPQAEAEPGDVDGWTDVPAAVPPKSAPVAESAEPAPALRKTFDFMPGREFRPVPPRPPVPPRAAFRPEPVARIAADLRLRAEPLERREDARRVPPGPRPASTPAIQEEAPLVSPATDAMVSQAFNTLIASRFLQSGDVMSEMVREMLKPMLKTWLDDNLPILVERLVRAEIERVARGAR